MRYPVLTTHDVDTDHDAISALDRGTSLMRNRLLLGPYSSPVPRGLGWSWRGARFLVGEVPL